MAKVRMKQAMIASDKLTPRRLKLLTSEPFPLANPSRSHARRTVSELGLHGRVIEGRDGATKDLRHSPHLLSEKQ